jgi:hypothetical protein
MISDDALGGEKEASAADRLTWFEPFLPDSRSKIIFFVAVTCYSFALSTLTGRLVRLCGLWPKTVDPIRHVVRNVRLGAEHSPAWTALILAPVLESLLIMGLIGLLRRAKFSSTLQIVGSTGLVCSLHSAMHLVWGFLVLPFFFIGAASYVYWRQTSFWTGTLALIWVHFFWNANAFLTSLSQ